MLGHDPWTWSLGHDLLVMVLDMASWMASWTDSFLERYLMS
jgi:hypothetical protein